MTDGSYENFYTGVLQGSELVGVGDVIHNPIPLRDGEPYPFLRRKVQGQHEPKDAYYAISGDYVEGSPVINRVFGTTGEGRAFEYYNDSYEV
jgi:hypothetical protein